MEDKNKTCSKKLHEKIEAIIYCKECNIYMCNKCKQSHFDLFESHHLFNLDKNINDIFTGLCKDANHNVNFEYFCKTHNILCCAKCISKFKNNGNGKHGNCDICIINDIKKEKKEKLNENIKILEELSLNLKQSINELKNMFERINEDKENLKLKIQKIFTQLRNKINNKEDEILARVDNKFNKLFFKEEFLKISENLPNKVNQLLIQGKNINNDWKEENSISLINDCINIEKNIININKINRKIKILNNSKIKIKFCKNNEQDEIENDIDDFGNIIYKTSKYSFRECPINIEENKKYDIIGVNQNMATKVGKNCWVGILGENKLCKRRINCWKIVLNTRVPHNILIGVASNDFNINKSSYYDSGWYICLCCNKLYSGAPHNYKNKQIELDLIFSDEVILIMDMKNKTLKIIMDSKEEEIYKDIPTDKPLFPAVFLKYQKDSVEIYDYYQEYKKLKKEKDKNENEEEKKQEENDEKKEEEKKEE